MFHLSLLYWLGPGLKYVAFIMMSFLSFLFLPSFFFGGFKALRNVLMKVLKDGMRISGSSLALSHLSNADKLLIICIDSPAGLSQLKSQSIICSELEWESWLPSSNHHQVKVKLCLIFVHSALCFLWKWTKHMASLL